MKSLQTSFSLIVLNLMILVACSSDIEKKNDLFDYNKLCEENENLLTKIEVLENDILLKDQQMLVLKNNAAYILALEPIAEYYTEEELFELIEEIVSVLTGNPFLTNYLVTASFGESTGFFPRDDHGGQDMIPINPGNMEWGIYATGKGRVVSDGEDIIHGKNIVIQNTDRIQTRFSHLRKYYYRAMTGKEVTTDTLIGEMGSTGYSRNAHLHYEIWIKIPTGKWVKINPKPFTKRGSRNV